MSYYIYNPMIARSERTLYRAGVLKLNKKQRGLDSLKIATRYLLDKETSFYKTIDLPIMMEEYYWLKNKLVIFPENKTLLNRLLKATSRVRDPARLFTDEQYFMLAIPKDFKITGLPGTGVLVTICNSTHRQMISDDFFDWLHLTKHGFTHTSDEMMICITYQHPGDVSSMYYRAIIPVSLVQKLLSAKTGEAYWHILGKFDASLHVGAMGLTHEQAAYQQVLVKLILAILLYKKTLPNALIDGYPVKNKRAPKIESVAVKNYHSITLQMPHEHHDSPAFHYRSWTFRQLFADRYYQHEYKDMKPGSRIVFVSGSFVNISDIQPATLKDQR